MPPAADSGPRAMPSATARTAAYSPEPPRRSSQARVFVARFVLLLWAIAWAGGAAALAMFLRYSALAGTQPIDGELISNSRRAAQIAFVLGLAFLAALIPLRGPKREWERILDLILQHRRSLNSMVLGSTVGVIVTMALPLLLRYVLSDIVNERRDKTALMWFFALLGLVLLVRAAASYLRTFHSQALAYRVATNLRHRLFAHLQQLSFGFFDRARQGELMSRLTNDVNVLQNFILNGSEDFLVAPLSVLAGLAGVFYLNWQLALVILAVAALTGWLMLRTFKRMKALYENVQSEMGELTAQLAEGLNTIRLAQSFGLEEDALSRFSATNKSALSYVLKHARIWAKLQPAIELLGFIAPLVIIFALCWQAISHMRALEVGELLAIVAYGALVANPLGKLARINVTRAGGEAASARIHEMLATRAEISDKRGALDLPDCEGRLSFEDVSLAYGEGQPLALQHISLDILPGQVVAFVGESGSGKSSLIHLVPRFYEPTAGRVLIDGHDLRDLTLASLRRQIGIVSQDTILVHGTVRENIGYGSPEADEKDIVDASMSANAHNFIMELPDGYDTMVGERGVTLSGGQRQRIAIARALLRDPRVLLLDEATSALDSVAEAVVQDALTKLMYGRTALMVAHRLSTVRHAHRIIVLKSGRVVEQGTHEELMTVPGGEYARLVKLQGLD